MINGFGVKVRYWLNSSIGDVFEKDITDLVVSTEDIAISAQRDWFSGCVAEVEMEFQVKKIDRTMFLRDVYADYRDKNGNYSDVFVDLYIDGTIIKTFTLNKATFAEYEFKYSFNLETPDLLNFMNSKGTFENKIDVKDLPTRQSFLYEPMRLACKATWTAPLSVAQVSEEKHGDSKQQICVLGLDFSKIEGVPDGRSIMFCRSQNADVYNEEQWSGSLNTFCVERSGCSFVQGKVGEPEYSDKYDTDKPNNNPPPDTGQGELLGMVRLRAKFSIGVWLKDEHDTWFNLMLSSFNVSTNLGSTVRAVLWEHDSGMQDVGDFPNKDGKDWDDEDTSKYGTYRFFDVEFDISDFPMTLNDNLVLYVYMDGKDFRAFDGDFRAKFRTFDYFEMTWEQKTSGYSGSTRKISMNADKIESVFNKIFEQNGYPNFKVNIFWDEPFDNIPLIVPAEELNGKGMMIKEGGGANDYESVSYHVKINDLMQLLQTMGYEYKIEQSGDITNLNFYRRHVLFSGTPIVVSENEKADLMLSHDTENTYSQLKIGYSKNESDHPTGKLDPVGTAEYDTGLALPQASICEMISPIRADIFGMERLTWERYSDGVDRENKDIFLIDCKKMNRNLYGGLVLEYYMLWDRICCRYYNSTTGVVEFYNALRTPYATVALNNADFLFSFSKEYKYVSGKAYKETPCGYYRKDAWWEKNFGESNTAYLQRISAHRLPNETDSQLLARANSYTKKSAVLTPDTLINSKSTISDVKYSDWQSAVSRLFYNMILQFKYGNRRYFDFNTPLQVEFLGHTYTGFVKEYEYSPIDKKANEVSLILIR